MIIVPDEINVLISLLVKQNFYYILYVFAVNYEYLFPPIADVASKMAQLETAFKKYQVAEAECEMYIACESSQVHRIEENGPLAKIVFDILR